MLESEDTQKPTKTNIIVINGIKYVILLAYVVCIILVVNYGFQSNIAAADLLDMLTKCNKNDYTEEYAISLKQKTQGFVTTIAIYVFMIVILGAICIFLYLTESKIMVRRVIFTVTIVIMIIFTITFVGLVSASNKNLDSLESSIKGECKETTEVGIANVRNSVRSVAITASLSMIFSFAILFIFIYNNSKVVKDTLDSYNTLSLSGDVLETIGVADLK
jgi:hypothetical protein